jgi:hypothetical protein
LLTGVSARLHPLLEFIGRTEYSAFVAYRVYGFAKPPRR